MRILVVMSRRASAAALGMLALPAVGRLGVLTGPCLGIDGCDTLPATGGRVALWIATGGLVFAALRLGGAARTTDGREWDAGPPAGVAPVAKAGR